MARREYRGGAVPLILATAIDAGDLTITTTGDPNGWPTGATNKFYVELDREEDGAAEKILIASRSGNVLTVDSRGVDDTTATSHGVGATVEHVLDSDTIDEANAHVNDDTRDDHSQYLNVTRHDQTARHLLGTSIASGVPGAQAMGDTASEGISPGAARVDHRHAMPSFGGTPPAESIGDTATAGSASTPARSDHRHAMPGSGTPGASAPGDTAYEGVSSGVARVDHRHSREAGPGLTFYTGGTDGSQGVSAGGEITMATQGVTVSATRLLHIHGSFDVDGASGGAYGGYLVLKVDGTTIDQKRWSEHGSEDVLYPSLDVWVSVAAGSHTVLLTCINDPGSVTVLCSARVLNVAVIGG